MGLSIFDVARSPLSNAIKILRRIELQAAQTAKVITPPKFQTPLSRKYIKRPQLFTPSDKTRPDSVDQVGNSKFVDCDIT